MNFSFFLNYCRFKQHTLVSFLAILSTLEYFNNFWEKNVKFSCFNTEKHAKNYAQIMFKNNQAHLNNF